LVGDVSIAKIRPLHTSPNLSSAVLAFIFTIDRAGVRPHKSGHWSDDGDEGPRHWRDLNPDFAPCKNGHHQSPFDIRNPQKADLPPIRFDYKPSPLHIIDTVIRS
jgi:carbonic anhydrase